MQHDPAAAGASDSDHPDLVDVTLNDGKYTIRQVPGGGWECLRYGEPWPAFADRQPDNLHIALAYEVDHLRDRVDGLGADLDSAVEVAFHHGATDWVRLNYPTHFERLSAAETATGLNALFPGNILEVCPGDKFILRVDGYPSSQHIERIHAKFKEFAGEDAKLLVLDRSAELSVLRGGATEQILPLESRESTHAGLAPAPGAEATSGADAGGTSARNMFAAHALPAILMTSGPGKLPEEVAQICFCIADTMVTESLIPKTVSPSVLQREAEVELLIQILLGRGADKIRIINDFPNRCGLSIPMNDVDDGEMFSVAELAHEDSGYAPALWQLAIAVLQSRRAALEAGL